ncbi:MAG TPA: ankyrin repeat domain-containing protein [Bryobacteraceae bacterium]|nr:ankyrin repeat domain-containing protein [Bryobacteraceae bacterium]
MKLPAFFLIFLIPAFAGDVSYDLLSAARKGQTQKVTTLLAKGGKIEFADKDGRTALMLAAEHGHADTVKVLLARGAKAEARDNIGWTAYGLAIFSSSGGREAVLKTLPERPPVRITLEPALSTENVYNSCLLKLPQLTSHVAEIQPEAQVAAALRDVALKNGKGVVEFISGPGDATLKLRVRPGASCVPQDNADTLSLAIDATLISGDNTLLMEKTYGGGLSGLHGRTVNSPAQYAPVYEEWAKGHAGQIYWAALEAWLRHR